MHCGDLISPFMLKELANFLGPVHLIYGNNSGDQLLISSRCNSRFKNITHHGQCGDFSIDGIRICMVHYPEEALRLASLDHYDIVCCGHSHVHGFERINNSLLINPGQLLGENDEAGFFLLELPTLDIQRVLVGSSMFHKKTGVTPGPVMNLSITIKAS